MLDLGEGILSAGGEINRVEDSLVRVGNAFGASRTNVFVLTSVINLTVTFPDGTSETETRRFLASPVNDLRKLEELNSICRACAKMDIYKFNEALQKVLSVRSNALHIYIGNVITALAFTLFFGGSLADSGIAALFAVFISLLQAYFSKICPNKVFFYLVTSIIIGSGIILTTRFINGLNVDKIIIGDIMLLIPGLAITNAIRDIIIGDTVSGIIKLSESLLWAISLAGGFMLALGLCGGVL